MPRQMPHGQADSEGTQMKLRLPNYRAMGRLASVGAISLSLVACSSSPPVNTTANETIRAHYEKRINDTDSEIGNLQASLNEGHRNLAEANELK